MAGLVVACTMAASVLAVFGLVFAQAYCRSEQGTWGLERLRWARMVAIGLALVVWSLTMGFGVWLWGLC